MNLQNNSATYRLANKRQPILILGIDYGTRNVCLCVFDFIIVMKNIFKKIKDWFYESNHDGHFWVGGAIFTISMFISTILELEVIQMLAVSDIIVFCSMASAEYKDNAWGGKFDWQDILAGMILPILFTLIFGIIYVIIS